jgi:hypothetical protein
LVASNGLCIEFVRNSIARKEDIVKKHFDGKKQGPLHILSAMEACQSYTPWHNKVSNDPSRRKLGTILLKVAKNIRYYIK